MIKKVVIFSDSLYPTMIDQLHIHLQGLIVRGPIII